jgi:hypothetical protein
VSNSRLLHALKQTKKVHQIDTQIYHYSDGDLTCLRRDEMFFYSMLLVCVLILAVSVMIKAGVFAGLPRPVQRPALCLPSSGDVTITGKGFSTFPAMEHWVIGDCECCHGDDHVLVKNEDGYYICKSCWDKHN